MSPIACQPASTPVSGEGDSAQHPAINWVLILLSASVLINYIDRSNLSIAADLIKGELHISDLQLGALLSAFFWTYGCLQIPAGWVVDRFDVKWVFATGFLLWSMATAGTGLLHGFTALIVVRVILGIGESVAFPSYCNILSTHFKENQRGNANAVITAGLALGPALGMLVGGTIVDRFGWRPFFLALGLGSLLWLIPWVAKMPRRPKFVAVESGPKVGILDILRQRSAWFTCLGQVCINYTLYLLVTWLPSYLLRGRHFTMGGMARVGGLVFLVDAAVSFSCGKLSDRWIHAGATATRVRKTMLGIGSGGMGVALVLTALVPSSLVIWTLVMAGMCRGISGGNCWAITQTLAGPRVAGRWAGVQNFTGNLAGAVAPLLTGYLLGRTGQFYWPLIIAAAISWIGTLSWLFGVGPVEPVSWEKEAGKRPFSMGTASTTGTARP